MVPPVLKTKLYIPTLRPALVRRTRLTEALQTGLERPLTLVSAPAGFGKTTLICSWIRECELPAAWLSLEEGDNDPVRFLSYLIAGLLAMTGMLSQAELVSAMPKAGGTHFYITRAMGPAVGTVDGLVTWFSLSLKSALALVGMAAFVALIVDVNMQLVTVGLVVLFILVNLLGIKEAGRMQVGLVTLISVK